MKRQKRRYVALWLDVDCVPGEREFLDAVWGSLTRLFGEVGASQAGLALISYDSAGKMAVLRANLHSVDAVRAALAAITLLNGNVGAVHVLAVSGTIKALRKNLKG